MKIKYLLILLFLVWTSSGYTQVNKIADSLGYYEIRLEKLVGEKEKLENIAIKLSKKISVLKSKKDFNRFDHSNLEKRLRESQSLAYEPTMLNRQIEKAQGRFNHLLEKRVKKIENKIKLILDQLELGKGKNNSLSDNLIELESERWRLQRRLPVELLSKSWVDEIQIEPDDSPQDIREKGDLLKDSEDKLLVEIDQIREQIIKIEDEIELRERMNQFVEDISFFDETDRLVDDDPIQSSDGIIASTEQDFIRFESEPAGIQKSPNAVDLLETKILLPRNLGSFTLEEMEEWLQFLNEHEIRLDEKIKKLGNKAERFYEQADEYELKEPQ